MDAKDELFRLTQPHLNWFYGPFSRENPPPMIPKNGDWVVVVYKNLVIGPQTNIGLFCNCGSLGDCFNYYSAACNTVDLWSNISAYTILPPFDAQKLQRVGEPSILRGITLREAIT